MWRYLIGVGGGGRGDTWGDTVGDAGDNLCSSIYIYKASIYI